MLFFRFAQGCAFFRRSRQLVFVIWFQKCISHKAEHNRGSLSGQPWIYTCSLVHTNLKFHPLHSETEGPVSDLIFRSIYSLLDSRMHSSIFNLISLFTQTQRGERRMKLTGLITSSHLLSPMCQNCISIIPSISILPVVSKGSCWCGEQELGSGTKLGHALWPQVLLLKSRHLFRGLQTTQVLSGAGVQRWTFTSAFRQSPKIDG